MPGFPICSRGDALSDRLKLGGSSPEVEPGKFAGARPRPPLVEDVGTPKRNGEGKEERKRVQASLVDLERRSKKNTAYLFS